MKAMTPCLISALFLGAQLRAGTLEDSNIVWDSPSADSKGSMPIGNGDIGLNVWVEPNGDLCFLVGKTDAWDENQRLLKLGKIRVKTTPSLVQSGQSFSQRLDLANGRIVIRSGDTEAILWVDANHPVVQVDVRSLSGKPLDAVAAFEVWRKEKRPLAGTELFNTKFITQPHFSWPDTILPRKEAQVGWYHRNGESPWLASLKLQKLDEIDATQKDPLLHRTCGAVLRGMGFVSASDTALKTAAPKASLSLRLHVLTEITDTAQAWQEKLEAQADATDRLSVEERTQAHAAWWKSFWDRSWIRIEASPAVPAEKPDAEGITSIQRLDRAYTLQRFVNACGGRGAYPIKFNGSIFIVDNAAVSSAGRDTLGLDADFRLWGGCYWFQNTRLTYWPMLAAGDYDLMQPFFNLYKNALPVRKIATRNYYGHDGAFFPETSTIWGCNIDENYGMNRKGAQDGFVPNSYLRYYWQGGIELVTMMLDYFDHTQDATFRDETLLPMAREITAFFDQHWQRGVDGKILFEPAQSLETYHATPDKTKNPLPEIAGLRYIIPRLMALPVDEATKAAWRKTLADLPPVPVRADTDGTKRLIPAEVFGKRSNRENPELYAVFPYRLYTLLSTPEDLAMAKEAWRARITKNNGGWSQNVIQAAMLGHEDEARQLAIKLAASTSIAKGFRFPVMWGPTGNWIPDQDHGGVLMNGLQKMLMLCDDAPPSLGNSGGAGRILLLPAWPKGWNVQFKLHAPANTIVECEVKDGKVVNLVVTPESRRKDVKVFMK